MSRNIHRKKKQNRFDAALIFVVLSIMLVLVSFSGRNLKSKQDAYALKKAELQQQITIQEERAKELEELKKYVQTDSYVEEVAQEKLGLVHSDEILFKLQK
ncbi:MAG: septum formation initiator family protein [Lachnospiraceae bacterium]|nr:septum formation initiator family protein [Lachnospiraceae bacterium]